MDAGPQLSGGPGKPGRFDDSTKTTIGVLVAMVVVLIAAGIGIATVRDAHETLQRVKEAVTTTTSNPSAGLSGATTTLAPANDLTAEQSRVVEEIKAQVATIRGLAWKGSLPIKVLTKDQLARRVRALNATEVAKNRDELTTDESILKLLQLIGKDVDYTKTLDAILAGGVLGFYDDETKELFVGGGDSATIDPATKATLAHELTHALTDQHFDFGTRTKALDDQHRTEESAAFSAVIEGDAELVANLWQERHLSDRERRQAASGSSADPGVYASAPPYLLASLFFPYEDGLNFVQGRYKAGGFAEVDKAYRNPPTSTEHILHPETYVSGQTWAPPQLPDLAAATGCGPVDTGTLGEFDMAQVLARKLTTNDAENAAAGWNGDAYSVVRCGAALGLADRWQTDDMASATRLADALTRWGKGWSGSTRATDAEGRFTGPAGSGRVVRTGGRVDLVLADDPATADKVSRALLAA
jgi:hypothetical protein